MEINALHENSGQDAHWAQLAPVLDAALNQLEAADRDALVLRYLEQRDLRSVGRALGSSEDAAQMRVARALEKLRVFLVRAGVTVASASALGTTLNASASAPLPAGLAASVATSALTGATVASVTPFTLVPVKTLVASKLALSVAATAAIAAVLAYSIGLSHHSPPVEGNAKPMAKQAPARPSSTVVRNNDGTLTITDGILTTPYGTLHIKPGASLGLDEYRSLITLQLGRLIKTDPQKALEGLAKWPPGPDTDKMYRQIFTLWSNDGKSSPQAAATAYNLPIGKDRDLAIQAVVDNWAKSDPASLLNWASSLATADSGTLTNAFSEVATKENQPALAAQYVDDVTDATTRAQAIVTIATAWGITDPMGTLTWLDNTATGDAYDTSVNNLMSNLAKQDPAQAAALVGNITEPGVQAAAIINTAGAWGATDPQAALAWVNSLPAAEAGAQNVALSSTVASWAKNDPAAALAYVQNSPDASIYLSAAPVIAGSLSQSDPQAALNWTNSLPAGADKDQALSNVLDNMAGTDFNSAWNYASSLPVGDGRDLAMAGLIGVEAKTNLSQAVTMVGQFPAGSAQNSATGQLADVWAVQNPNAFVQWVTALPPGGQQDAALAAAITAANSSNKSQAAHASLVQRLTKIQAALKSQSSN